MTSLRLLALPAILLGLSGSVWAQGVAASPPPSTVIAKELTPEQAEAIRNGEKMAKIVQKLEPKTRNAIQAEMQKP